MAYPGNQIDCWPDDGQLICNPAVEPQQCPKPETDEVVHFYCIITADGERNLPWPQYERITFHKAGKRIERTPITEEEYYNATFQTDHGTKDFQKYLESQPGIAAAKPEFNGGKLIQFKPREDPNDYSRNE